MATGVEELLDMLFEMVDEAKNVPLSGDKCMLERDRALDLIDDIRAQFPMELSEAKKLVETRNDFIAAAKREAEIIRKQAEAEAQRILAEETILAQTKHRSVELMKQYFDNSDFFVAIGNAKIRAEKTRKFLEQGVNIATLIHPSAIIGEAVTIGKGTVIMAGTILNAECKIGDGCIINTAASVDHDCKILDYVHVSVGAHVCGTVMVSENTWIGAGATVSNNINICADCMIGAGAVVVKNIEEPGTYVGVPARKIG